VAGGVSSASDLRAIAGIGPPVEGAVVGRALYEGGAGPEELFRALRS
jgi:phosphoribosylformimino-5-aminoimidazole carboxamide ribonucleotide (ProFAR) isomerase